MLKKWWGSLNIHQRFRFLVITITLVVTGIITLYFFSIVNFS